MSTTERQSEAGHANAGQRRDTVDRPESDSFTRLAVLTTLVLVGLHLQFGGRIAAGLLLVVALTPMWWGRVGRFGFARLIMRNSAPGFNELADAGLRRLCGEFVE